MNESLFVANFVMGRLSEAGSFLRTLRTDGSLPSYSLPTGCGWWGEGVNARTRPNFKLLPGATRECTPVHSVLTVEKYVKIYSAGSRSKASRTCSRARDTQSHVCGGHRVI